MHLSTKLAATAAAAAASLALAAGVPALASSHASASGDVTGQEFIAGSVHGKAALSSATIIPLQWYGLVTTNSTINLGGSGPRKGSVKTLTSPAGNLTVMVTSKPASSSSVNSENCRVSFAENIPVTVVGSKSTGEFEGASGSGAVNVGFAITAPRYQSGPKEGQCNPSGKPSAKGAVATFAASLMITTE